MKPPSRSSEFEWLHVGHFGLSQVQGSSPARWAPAIPTLATTNGEIHRQLGLPGLYRFRLASGQWYVGEAGKSRNPTKRPFRPLVERLLEYRRPTFRNGSKTEYNQPEHRIHLDLIEAREFDLWIFGDFLYLNLERRVADELKEISRLREAGHTLLNR